MKGARGGSVGRLMEHCQADGAPAWLMHVRPPWPHRSEVELAAIAHELDAAERELMASAGVDSAEFAAYVAEGSGNVAEHGMFSIQVGQLVRCMYVHTSSKCALGLAV